MWLYRRKCKKGDEERRGGCLIPSCKEIRFVINKIKIADVQYTVYKCTKILPRAQNSKHACGRSSNNSVSWMGIID